MAVAFSQRRAISGEQERVIGVLRRFLRRTLVILALAIVGLVFADILNAWVVTAVIARLLIAFAGYRLSRDTYSVVREAARRDA
jgi:small-conductance mechanosensitive channel